MKKFALIFLLIPFLAEAITFSSAIPYPFYNEDHTGATQMMPLHRGEESLQLRLDLIARAKRTIDVEYYIYEMDMSSKIFTRELVKAAQRGVKVRILVDKFISHINSYVGHELAQFGIELRYYNTKSLLKFTKINYRDHRKLLIVDGEEAITGGRNLGDDYFNLNERYNFDDRDVYVKGPLVKPIRDSFMLFFENEITHEAKRKKKPELRVGSDGRIEGRAALRSWEKKVKAAKEFLEETEEELRIREAIAEVGSRQLAENALYSCPIATFVSDAPGATYEKTHNGYQHNYRNVRKTFLDKILPVDKALTISSPYFIPNDRNEFIFEEILKRGVPMVLYSNSLRSTDSIMMSASLYLHLREYIKKGMQVYFHDGGWSQDHDTAVPDVKKTKFGTHSKTHVYETSKYTEVMIGTYNVDNRSDYFNAELGVFCKGNDDFTRNVKADIMALAERGLKVETLAHARDRNGKRINITGSSPIRRLKMKLLTLPSWLFGYLL